MTTKDIVLVALFAAIIVALGFLPPITLAFIPVPITAQSMGVMLAGTIIGAKRGAASYVLVVLMVAIGLPVLAGGAGGLQKIMGPTGGYIIGWIFGAFVTGLIAERLVHDGQPEVRQYIGFFLASIAGGTHSGLCVRDCVAVLLDRHSVYEGADRQPRVCAGDLIKAVIATLAARAVLAGYPMLPSRA